VLTNEQAGNTHSSISSTATIVSTSLSDPNPSNNTATSNVSLDVLLAAPTPTLPLDGASTNDRRPILTWDNVPGAVTYEIQLGTTTLLATTIDNLTANSYTPVTDLATTTYYWRVRVTSASGTPSPWSDMHSFTILSLPDAKPELGYYPPSSIKLSWSAVSWAIGYEVEVNTDSHFPEQYSFRQELGPTSLSTVVALPSGTYYWRVHARRSATEWGDWSQPIRFTVATN
jgi:hypothetical protein